MIITIARQCGCGALEVGRLLAERYGIPLYTRNPLQEAARARGMLQQMEDFFEERPVDELMSAITFSFDRDDAAGLSGKSWGVVKSSLLAYSVVTVISTFVVMGISGAVTQIAIRRGHRNGNDCSV